MTQVSGPPLKNRTHSPPYGKCDWFVCVTKWNCLIASFFAVCSIIPSSWSFQQQLGSILPAAAAAGGLADTRAFESMECGLFGFHTCVYVVFHTCVCCRPEWVGLPKTQHFWILENYLRPLALSIPALFVDIYGHIFSFSQGSIYYIVLRFWGINFDCLYDYLSRDKRRFGIH